MSGRWHRGEGYKNSTLFYKAICKYGWESFSHDILESGEWTKEEVNEKEKYYIALFHANQREYGYNILEGGNCELSDLAKAGYKKYIKEHPERIQQSLSNMWKWQREHPEEAKKIK